MKKTKHPSTVKPEQPDQIGLERLVFFSDAIFAIAATLLALELHLPGGEVILDEKQLGLQLSTMWHQYLGYIVSFLVIGVFWVAHHRKFGLIRRYDRGLLTWNLLLLMVIASIPFPSSLISTYPGRTATIFYALTMVLAGLIMSALWAYASRQTRLTDPGLDARTRRREFLAPLATSLVFLLSIGIAFLSPGLARLSWVLIIPASWMANKS